jgi:hypothetical protein
MARIANQRKGSCQRRRLRPLTLFLTRFAMRMHMHHRTHRTLQSVQPCHSGPPVTLKRHSMEPDDLFRPLHFMPGLSWVEHGGRCTAKGVPGAYWSEIHAGYRLSGVMPIHGHNRNLRLPVAGGRTRVSPFRQSSTVHLMGRQTASSGIACQQC